MENFVENVEKFCRKPYFYDIITVDNFFNNDFLTTERFFTFTTERISFIILL